MIRRFSLRSHVWTLLGAAIFLLASGARGAEDSSYVRITIRDNAGHHRLITIGVHTAASRGFDKGIGEMPLPPFPPIEAFDARCLVPDTRRLYAGDGSGMDVRFWESTVQSDTFLVRIQAARAAYPIIVACETGAVGAFARALIHLRGGRDTAPFDLQRSTTLVIDDPEIHSLLIVLQGPHRVAGGGDSGSHHEGER